MPHSCNEKGKDLCSDVQGVDTRWTCDEPRPIHSYNLLKVALPTCVSSAGNGDRYTWTTFCIRRVKGLYVRAGREKTTLGTRSVLFLQREGKGSMFWCLRGRFKMEMQVLVEGKVLCTRKEKSSVLRGLDFAKFWQVQEETGVPIVGNSCYFLFKF